MDIRNYASATPRESHFYADGTSGDDANDGLTVSTPVKTLARAAELIPDLITKNTCLHLSGVFAETGTINIYTKTAAGMFYVDGGSDVTDILAALTSDINSTTSIGLSSQSWTVDQYKGYWVEILTGPAAGQKRTIHSNTATTLTPQKDFSVDPGSSAQFRIVRPSTTISGRLIINCPGTRPVRVQNLYFTGSNASLQILFSMYVNVAAVITDSSYSSAGYFYGNKQSNLNGSVYDPDTFNYISSSTTYLGVSILNSSTTVWVIECVNSYLVAVVSNGLIKMEGCGLFYAGSAFNIRYLELESCWATFGDSCFLVSNSGYAVSKISNPSGVGLVLRNTVIGIDGIDISGCSSHGAEISQSSNLYLYWNAVTGSGNGGAGVFLHDGANVYTKGSAVHTLTGTVGELSTDGTTEDSTWANILAGGDISMMSKNAFARKIG